MIMEKIAVVGNDRLFDRALDDVRNERILASSLREIFMEVDQNPPLPPGWEKCLDLQSGNVYFKDKITRKSTFKDPRKKQSSALRNYFFGGGSSGPTDHGFGNPKHYRKKSSILEENLARFNDYLSNSGSEEAINLEPPLKVYSGTFTCGKKDEGEVSGKETIFSSKTEDIQPSVEESSFRTVEKAKDALKHPQFGALSRNDSGCTNSSLSSLHALSLNLPSPSSPSLWACRSSRSYASSNSSYSSSHSIMSFQSEEPDDLREEASSCDKTAIFYNLNQSVVCNDDESGILVTFGCQHCLMYIMLPKANPCCPKCGSSDLLEIKNRFV